VRRLASNDFSWADSIHALTAEQHEPLAVVPA
jgi:hypothetical protein